MNPGPATFLARPRWPSRCWPWPWSPAPRRGEARRRPSALPQRGTAERAVRRLHGAEQSRPASWARSPASCPSMARDGRRAQITDVRVGTHAGYDRVVIEFDEGIPPFIPDEAAAAARRPERHGDGRGGLRLLVLVLQGGTRVTVDGTESYDGPTDFTPDFPGHGRAGRGRRLRGGQQLVHRPA